MLRLSNFDKNPYAVPGMKYLIKTKTSPRFEIATYKGGGEFERDLFGLHFDELKNFKINPEDKTKRYVVGLDVLLKNKSYRDLAKKSLVKKKDGSPKTNNKKKVYEYEKSYSHFMDVLYQSFLNLPKEPAKIVKGNDVISDDFTLEDLLQKQFELSSSDFIKSQKSQLSRSY